MTKQQMIKITRVGRHRYIDAKIFEETNTASYSPTRTWIAQPGYEALVQSFLRNQVSLLINNNKDTRRSELLDSSEWFDLWKDLSLYCNEACTGFWNYEIKNQRDGTYLFVYFENEADIDPFLKDFAVKAKLTYS